MIPAPYRRLIIAVFCAAVAASCSSSPALSGPRTVQPGAPGEASRVVSAADGAASMPKHTEADVRFMQGMIAHHAQAIEMSALVPDRSASADMNALARRIDISQQDEIRLMQRWLADRQADVPDATSHKAHGDHGLMPGMLTSAQMERLAGSTGVEFERLFLAGMIRHHEGALVMVKQLFSSPGAGQEPDIFRFASDVDTDQRAEIARMRNMLQQRGNE